MQYKNLPTIFFNQVNKSKENTALEYRIRRNEPYIKISWEKFGKLVTYVAHGLISIGLRKGDNVAIISDTKYEWAVCDFSVLSTGGVVVPVYPTLPDLPVNYIVNNSEAKIVIVENKGQLQKIRGQWDKLPTVEYVVVIDDFGDLPKDDPRIISLSDIIDKGENSFDNYPLLLKECIETIDREDTATIIYTSGTTGNPKGVVLTHGNLLSVVEVLPSVLLLKDTDKFLSFLPLSHVFERVGGLHYAISVGASTCYTGAVDRIGKSLTDSKATVMCVVPRLLEKMYGKINETIDALPESRKNLVKWAIAISQNRNELIQEKKIFNLKYLSLTLKYFFAKFILRKIRKNIAPALRCFISGGAPLSPEIAGFFLALGLPVYEGYGLTETSAPATVNAKHRHKIGTVGRPIPNVKIKIAEDGEILIKGPTVFSQYYKNELATKESFIDDWFKSGDIGIIDKDGFLKITDRKKDLIVNSAGKKVAPQIIENSIKTSPYISNVVVIGDKRKYLSALVTLNPDSIINFANKEKIKFNPDKLEDLYKTSEINSLIKEEINLKTASYADYEQIIRFKILSSEFSVESGEITPTLKVKRKFVETKYKELIDGMYVS